MSHIIDNIIKIKNNIPSNVTLVAATKYATLDDIKTLSTHMPNLILGENRVQQGEEKQKNFPFISNPWHFIGHLQRNKINKVINHYDLIQSVDRVSLIDDIQKKSAAAKKNTGILLQVNPLNDEKKFGFNEQDLEHVIETRTTYPNISILGLMCMAPFDSNETIIKKTFSKTKTIYDNIKSTDLPLKYLSMGMSNDYKIAIDEGSNMIRIGSIIFSCQS